MTDVTLPVDSAGVTFDPNFHNLLEDTAKPQLTSTGKFQKANANNPNSAELIQRFVNGLIAEQNGVPEEVEKPGETAPKQEQTQEAAPKPSAGMRYMKMARALAAELNAEIYEIEGSQLILYRQDVQTKGINLANHETIESAKNSLAMLGMT